MEESLEELQAKIQRLGDNLVRHTNQGLGGAKNGIDEEGSKHFIKAALRDAEECLAAVQKANEIVQSKTEWNRSQLIGDTF